MNRTRYYFNYQDESTDCYNWIQHFLVLKLKDSHKHEDPESIKEEIDELFEEIEIFNSTSNQAENGLDEERIAEIWNKILQLNESTFLYEREPENISWGVWRIEKKQQFNFGYTEDSIFSVYVPENSDQKIHEYKKIPPILRWKLNKVVQKDFVFYTACAKVEEIEQVSSVPSLPIDMTSMEAGYRVLDSERGEEEWQRRPMPKRIQSITDFVEIEQNIVANAPILYIKDSSAVTLMQDELIIDFSKFLIQENPQQQIYIDHQKHEQNSYDGETSIIYKDLRPVWLIDGQHRVRGLSRSIQGGQLYIPIIIFPASFGLPHAAKIFAEINTLQVSLTSLHKLFMQHRFKISSPVSNRNFESWENMAKPHKDSRANHLSYELLARLASNNDSGLFDKIKILDQNQATDFYVKADQWVNYARNWFIHGPYSQNTKWNQNNAEDIYKEVNNYFKALIQTVNHSGWRDGKPRWPDTFRNKSLLQSSTHFKVLIDLFIDVYSRLKPKSNGIYEIDNFMEVLAPFKWVDWIDPNFKKMFGGGGEKGRSSLYIWMLDALSAKESYPLRTVMAETIRSQAGQGILAPPAKSEIIVQGTWPKLNQPIIFTSTRPVNARRKPLWIFQDDKGNINDVLKIHNNNECFLHYEPYLDKLKYFKITVTWSNASSTSATSEIKIQRPLA